MALRIAALVAALVAAAPAFTQAQTAGPSNPTTPQHVICDSGCAGSGGGGTVDQGTGGVSAWKVNFGGTAQPVDLSDNAARLVGKVTFDGAQAVTQSGAWSVSFTAPQHIVCDSGCGGAATFTDNSAFTFGTTPVNNAGYVVDDVATNAVAENSSGAPRMTTARIAYADLSKSASNTNSFKVDFGGAGQPVTQSGGWSVSFTAPQHVIADSGSTTVVTGNVTVIQPTGTALHSVLDTTSTTAVTQATGTNLHAVLDTTSTTAVTQATGTNLHAVLDTTSTTAVTQATGTNLHAVIDSGAVTNTPPANQSVNLAQVGGTTTSVSSGNTDNGTQRVILATDQPNLTSALNVACATCAGAFTDSGTFTPASSGIAVHGAEVDEFGTVPVAEGQAGALRMTANRVLLTRASDANGNASTDEASIVAQLIQTNRLLQSMLPRAPFAGYAGGAMAVVQRTPPPANDPCQGVMKGSVAISQAGNTKLLSGTGKPIYVCHVLVVASDAENISLVEGNGSTCGTGTAAVIGGATAANGPNLAANGGFVTGNGAAAVAIQATPGNDLCLFQSGSGRVAGVLTYAYPQ